MASLRTHTRIARPADDVWSAVSDAGGISTWFPGIEQSSASGSTRSCTLAGGTQLEEDIVNVDPALRRFQYRITVGMPVEHHLGTIDVFEDGEGQSLVVYSTEVTPDAVADLMGPSIEGGLQGLKAHLESGA